MNANLFKLHAYPFERLTQLKTGIEPPPQLAHIALSIGEPKHPAPDFVKQILCDNIDQLAVYPTTKGSLALRQSIGQWLQQRFNLSADQIDPERHILPVAGTREALFAFTQAVIDACVPTPVVVSPNPFYQIYEGAAILAGAELYYLDTLVENDFIADVSQVPEAIWQRCQLLQLCSPGNPTGAVMSLE